MTGRDTKITGKRVITICRFLEDILNLDEYALALNNNLQAGIERILTKEPSFLFGFQSSSQIFQDLAKEGDVSGDVICLL